MWWEVRLKINVNIQIMCKGMKINPGNPKNLNYNKTNKKKRGIAEKWNELKNNNH